MADEPVFHALFPGRVVFGVRGISLCKELVSFSGIEAKRKSSHAHTPFPPPRCNTRDLGSSDVLPSY